MSMTDKCDVLRKINLFCGLDTAALNVLADQLVRERFAPDETLCVEGKHGDRMFVIESGDVAAIRPSSRGKHSVRSRTRRWTTSASSSQAKGARSLSMP